MDEKLKELVLAAHVHSLIVAGERIVDDIPDEDEEIEAWVGTKDPEYLISIVAEYLRGSI